MIGMIFNKGAYYQSMKRKVSIESYRKLVAMQAWKAWRHLPMQTRMWIDIEDMVEDGMMQAWKLTQTYNPNWANFTTALYHRLHKFFINEYLEQHSALKRGWTKIKEGDGYMASNKRFGQKRAYEFQSLDAIAAKDNKSAEETGVYPPLVVSPDSITNNVMTECFVVPALERIYKEASPKLQNSIFEWFITTEASRIHTGGQKFNKRAKEFRELCKHASTLYDLQRVLIA